MGNYRFSPVGGMVVIVCLAMLEVEGEREENEG